MAIHMFVKMLYLIMNLNIIHFHEVNFNNLMTWPAVHLMVYNVDELSIMTGRHQLVQFHRAS